MSFPLWWVFAAWFSYGFQSSTPKRHPKLPGQCCLIWPKPSKARRKVLVASRSWIQHLSSSSLPVVANRLEKPHLSGDYWRTSLSFSDAMGWIVNWWTHIWTTHAEILQDLCFGQRPILFILFVFDLSWCILRSPNWFRGFKWNLNKFELSWKVEKSYATCTTISWGQKWSKLN